MTARATWPEIRARANDFVAEWSGESSERSESQTFWNEFFGIFGLRRRHVASFEKQVSRLSNISGKGSIDVFWPKNILIEHKSRGENLMKAADQAMEYFDGLKLDEYPRIVLICDFENFVYRDLENDRDIEFTLKDLPLRVDLFGFLAGHERQVIKDDLPVNRKAAELMGTIHDALEKAGYHGHNLEVFLMRLMFCLFAEDASIFKLGAFYVLIDNQTREDGSDLGMWLNELFKTLDKPIEHRPPALDESLKDFPHVNGKLFKEDLPTVWLNRDLRQKLLDASINFNWGQISAAVFGSLFQSIMDKKKRRDLGAHYTSEKSILRLIKPLFLDRLESEFEALKARSDTRKSRLLDDFHTKLAEMRFLDPACGCGNFLVIAYRELRLLEFKLIKEIIATRQADQQLVTDISLLVRMNVDQFGGIEIEEWPARIAETALWLTDHQMNRKLEEIGQVFERLPLKATPHIRVGNALREDWANIFPKNTLTYILGNPPFRGKQHQDAAQKADMKMVFGSSAAGVLDYVCAWYRKAAEFVKDSRIECAFVSTNSVAQGEQVVPLWKHLAPFNLTINFAHQYFDWDTDGRGKAGVYVVIIGFANIERQDKEVVVYDDIREAGHTIACTSINSYLVPDGANVLVASRRKPLCASPSIQFGNMANEARPAGDTRSLFFFDTLAEYNNFLHKEPSAKKWIRQFVGSDELIGGTSRWCLWLEDALPSDIKGMPLVYQRVEMIRKNRLSSPREETNRLADTPYLFGEIRQPKIRYLALPLHSSENRDYIPFVYLAPETIIGNACSFIAGADLFTFGVLQSAMHMAWVRAVGGRLEGRYRYSNGLVYNTFPWPNSVSSVHRQSVEKAAQAVLDARVQYAPETLDKLYDPGLTPKELGKAHKQLNTAVDICYGHRFKTENERLQFLFRRYETLVSAGQMNLLPEEPSKTSQKKGRRKAA